MKTVVVSLDAELGWGFHDHDDPPTDRVESARPAWFRLVDLFERSNVPATWAIVGHLFLDWCDGTHTDHPAGSAWFGRDPGGDSRSKPDRFGRDLITSLRDSDVDHEIGTHTFSHVEFGKAETTREVADAELRQAKAVAAEDGLELQSMVFPRNNVGHLDVLADHGVLAYRGVEPARWFDGRPGQPLGKLAEYTFGLSAPNIVDPYVDEHGLVNVPASLYLYGFEGTAKRLASPFTTTPVLDQVEAGLDALVDRGEGVFHLWLHPNNLTTESDIQRMARVVDLLATYRRDHDVEIRTMSDVATEVLRSEPATEQPTETPPLSGGIEPQPAGKELSGRVE
jgi:peptidoglycan/xylan/chitin deacetylase (PgdA/CDA1 family)